MILCKGDVKMWNYTQPTGKEGKQWIQSYDFEGYWRNFFHGRKIKILRDRTIRLM